MGSRGGAHAPPCRAVRAEEGTAGGGSAVDLLATAKTWYYVVQSGHSTSYSEYSQYTLAFGAIAAGTRRYTEIELHCSRAYFRLGV